MYTIDSHQHFWKYSAEEHSWIGEEMAVIRKDFLPEQLAVVLEENDVHGCIAIQADQSTAETDFLLGLAADHELIKGVVGWADLQSPGIEPVLEYYAPFKKLKGFRHILQGEPQRDLMLQPSFLRGIAALGKYDFTYDILINSDQLRYIPALVSRFPDQRFVIDHMAKPSIKEHEISSWKRDIGLLAAHKNVCCKLSGMITEADLKHWTYEELVPYLDVVADTFGTGRIMYGSDWPVCLAAGEYADVIGILRTYFNTYSTHEQSLFFAGNAKQFYRL